MIVAGLRSAYAHYDAPDLWVALGVTMDLFGDATRQLAGTLGVAYPADIERRARSVVQDVSGAADASHDRTSVAQPGPGAPRPAGIAG